MQFFALFFAGLLFREDMPPGIADILTSNRYVLIKRKDEVNNIILRPISNGMARVVDVTIKIYRNLFPAKIPSLMKIIADLRHSGHEIVYNIGCAFLDVAKARSYGLPDGMANGAVSEMIVVLLPGETDDDIKNMVITELNPSEDVNIVIDVTEIEVARMSRDTRVDVRVTDLKRIEVH